MNSGNGLKSRRWRDGTTPTLRRSNHLTWLAAAVISLLLSGCSGIRLAYNNVDDLSYWWLDRYLSFNDMQSLTLRPELAKLQRWHRREELPAIAGLLARVRKVALADTTPDAVCDYLGDITPRLRALLDAAEPATLAIATTLTASQLDSLQARYSKNNEEFRSDWLDQATDKRDQKRLERLINNTERFYGSLNSAQIATLKDLVSRIPFNGDLIFREIQRRQQDTLTTLRQLAQRPPAEASLMMRGLLRRSLESPDAEYERYVAQTRAVTCTGLANLHNVTSPEKRQDLVNNLASYEDDMRSLIAQGN